MKRIALLLSLVCLTIPAAFAQVGTVRIPQQTGGTQVDRVERVITPTAANQVLGFDANKKLTNLTIGTIGTITSGKTVAFTNSLTFSGTDGITITFPATSATIARTDAANTFTGHQTIEGVTSTGATGTGKLVYDGSPTLVTPVIGAATGTSLALSNYVATTAPVTETASTHTLAATENYLIANASGTCTVTLGTATAGRAVTVKTIAAQTVVSASSNVKPIDSGTAGTAILAGTAGKWARLVGDGTNWIVMESN